MNEYEKAYERCASGAFGTSHWVKMKELVSRATPIKPRKYEYGGYQCPNCKGLYVQSRESDNSEVNLNFCNDCGQALDWSDVK